ncbi:MAG: glycosyl hydrolase 53 family protein [Fibrobacter sp.]|uniref:glycosyl hydrolase 53 family protein n=1 Tax=Fibrobacter sp. TaxID=35828 RepID=UPI0025BD0477|nr:glycosyl hydrolase 53 family protein [Fibrobacter sp.]MBQ7081192.1 glycosyl hydrolase 53 family protein [Fibrobacter sp.]
MSILKSSFIGLACVSLAILSQGCGDDSALSSAVILSSESHEESSNSNTLTSSAVQSSSSSSAALNEVYDSSSSTNSPTSSFAESSSSKDVEPVETSSSSSHHSELDPELSSSSRHSGLDPESSSSQHFGPDPESSSSSSSRHSVPDPESSSSAKPVKIDFFNGADISEVQEYERNNTKFYDVDGKESDIFTILKNHGFNSIRLRTFVSPKAKYGYAANGCGHDAEAYGDKDHVVAYAKKVKAAGMGLLVDIHYSDVWADPGKQIIPERWRGVNNANAMADSVYAYTKDLMIALKNAGATPDMVQVGNETTPGILIHKPNSKTDCWGNGVDKAATSVNGDMGTAAGKANAAKYFNAGIKAVKEVSPTTKTVLHIERIRQASTVNWWMGVIFDDYKIPADVMGFSAYTAYGDGSPDNWKSLFNSLTSKYSKLEFIVAEYNGGDSDNHYKFDGSRKKTREMISGMNHWIGTFFWEPTIGGAWGPSLFDKRGKDLYANAKAFEEFF